MLCLSHSKVLLRNPVDCQNYTEILLHLWFSAWGNCAIQGTFGGTEDIVMVTLGEEGRMLLAPGRERTERVLNTLQCYSAQHSPPKPSNCQQWCRGETLLGSQEWGPRKFAFLKSISHLTEKTKAN